MPAPQTPVDPAAEPQRHSPQVQAASAFSLQLGRAARQLSLYRHNEAQHLHFVRPAFDLLTRVTTQFGALELDVQPEGLSPVGHAAASSETASFAFRFHGEGVRRLRFEPGLSIEEFVVLVRACAGAAPGQPPISLDEPSWTKVRVTFVSGVARRGDTALDADETLAELERSLFAALKTRKEAYAQFAQLGARLLTPGQPAPSNPTTPPFAARATRAARRLAANEDVPLERPMRELARSLLKQGEVGPVLQWSAALHADSAMGAAGPARAVQTVDAELLAPANEALLERAPEQTKGHVLWLLTNAAPVSVLIAQLPRPERAGAARECLRAIAANKPNELLAAIADADEAIAVELLGILEESAPARFAATLTSVLSDPRPQVVIRSLELLAKKAPDTALESAAGALRSTDGGVRARAARLLSDLDPARATRELQPLVRAADFESRPREEQVAILSALASTGVALSMQPIEERLHAAPKLLHRRKHLEDRLLAVEALAAAGTAPALKALQKVIDDEAQPVEVKIAARKAHYLLKRALMGTAA